MSSLIYRERPAAGDPAGLLVLHHGRGANEDDLLGFADVLDPQRRLHVVTPRAPLSIGGGYHWYLVPRVGFPDHDTFHAAHAKLAAFHDELWQRTGIAPGKTVFGGFSMGSVMSYSLGLAGDRPTPAGILTFSGFIPTVDGWQPDLSSRPDLRCSSLTGDMTRSWPSSSPAKRTRCSTRPDCRSSTRSPTPAHHIDPAHVPAAVQWLDRTIPADTSAPVAAAQKGR